MNRCKKLVALVKKKEQPLPFSQSVKVNRPGVEEDQRIQHYHSLEDIPIIFEDDILLGSGQMSLKSDGLSNKDRHTFEILENMTMETDIIAAHSNKEIGFLPTRSASTNKDYIINDPAGHNMISFNLTVSEKNTLGGQNNIPDVPTSEDPIPTQDSSSNCNSNGTHSDKEFELDDQSEDTESVFNVSNEDKSDLESTGTEANDLSRGKNKRAKRRDVDKTEWRRNKNKIKRMKGETYLGFTRKNGEWKNNKMRKERKLKERCKGKHNEKNKVYQCDKITEEERNLIFIRFWTELSWDQKKMFVINNIEKVEPKRRKSENKAAQKSETLFYYLKKENRPHRVCKRMFLNTLCIGEWSVREWCKAGSHGMVESAREKIAKRRESTVSKIGERKKFLENWFDQLPKIPSHYCRADSKKKYIEDSLVKNKSQLYKRYVACCGGNPLSNCIFDEVFEKKNIGIFQARKDKCDVCCGFETDNLNQQEYETHVANKDRARLEKQQDKEHSLKGKCHVLTMDLQAVQLCPRMYASTLYYKQKLRVHNFTVYNLASHQSTNHWRHEGEGKVDAAVFASCIIDYLHTHFSGSEIPIILYSDGCGYQNRNSILANALIGFSVSNNVVIKQKYLVKGHTQMECDTVHSLIERRLNKREIYLPGEYVTITRQARQKPFALDAKYLHYEFFKNYSDPAVQWYSSIRPPGATVSEIRSIKYAPTGVIYVKTDLDCEYQLLRKIKNIPVGIQYKNLYSSKPKISLEKYQQLLEITKVMDPDYHSFYQNLPHETKKKVIFFKFNLSTFHLL